MKINMSREYQGFEELENALINANQGQLQGLSQNERKVCQKIVELIKNPDKALVSFTLKSQPNLKEIAQKIQNAPGETDKKRKSLSKGIANIFGRISSKSLVKQIDAATSQTKKFIHNMKISNAEKKELLALNDTQLKKALIDKVQVIVKSPQKTSEAAKSDETNFLMFASNILRDLGDVNNPIHDDILRRIHPFLN